MKMSEEFDFEVEVKEAGKNAYFMDANDIAFAKFENAKEAKAAAHAINMHDKLVSLVEKMALQADCIDDIVDEFVGQRSLPEVAKEQQKMLELMSEAKTLLTQAKGE